MARTQPSGVRTHTFAVTAPQAREVAVAGSFNGWSRQAMKPSGAGKWSTIIELKPGRHEFKFIVDGQWCCEHGRDGACPDCKSCVPNAFGTMNRVFEID